MSKIESVLGPIDTSELGFTLSHEHVVVSSAGIPQIYPEFIRRDESILSVTDQSCPSIIRLP